MTTVDPKLELQAPAVAAACAEDKHWTMYVRVVAPPSDAAFAVMVMVIAVGLSRVDHEELDEEGSRHSVHCVVVT